MGFKVTKYPLFCHTYFVQAEWLRMRSQPHCEYQCTQMVKRTCSNSTSGGGPSDKILPPPLTFKRSITLHCKISNFERVLPLVKHHYHRYQYSAHTFNLNWSVIGYKFVSFRETALTQGHKAVGKLSLESLTENKVGVQNLNFTFCREYYPSQNCHKQL